MKGPDFRMDGKVALITGAGRGIGLGIAQGLASAGCAVAVQDIEIDVAEEAAGEIERQGGRAIALGGDITDLSIAPKLIDQTSRQLGGLHVLINNAAIQKPQHWLEMTVDDMERQLRADLIAPILLCQAAAGIFKPQRFGRIISLGSIQQKKGNPNMLAYSLSKAALERMTVALARDLAGDNITVNLIAPGYFNTYRNRGDFPTEKDVREKGKWVPLGRIGEPEDCAGIALLLCSEAGSYITGQNIYVDGGMAAYGI